MFTSCSDLSVTVYQPLLYNSSGLQHGIAIQHKQHGVHVLTVVVLPIEPDHAVWESQVHDIPTNFVTWKLYISEATPA